MKSLGKGITLTIEETRDLTAFLVDVQNMVEYLSETFTSPQDIAKLKDFFDDSERIGMNIIAKYKDLRKETLFNNSNPGESKVIPITRKPLKVI